MRITGNANQVSSEVNPLVKDRPAIDRLIQLALVRILIGFVSQAAES